MYLAASSSGAGQSGPWAKRTSARCLSIADAFDAMITDRPYRKGLPVEYAIQQLREGAGKQFDPQLAPVFAQMVEERQIPLAVDRGRGRRRDESL